MVKLSPPLRAFVVYAAFGTVWIWWSDRALSSMGLSADAMTWIQSVKGWAFVLASGLLIAWIVAIDLRRLRRANQRLLDGHEQAIRTLVVALDARHHETRDHSQRVARMTVALARLSGIEDEEMLRRIEFGALLHDIGKLVIPDAVLTKPGPLDAEEMEQVRQHPDIGRDLLLQIDFLCACLDIPYCHHERWDGHGYPRGLRGEDIPYAARLFSVVDVWDALIHPRVYKPAWTVADVRAYLQREAGAQFDPKVVSLFLTHYDELAGIETMAPMARDARRESGIAEGEAEPA